MERETSSSIMKTQIASTPSEPKKTHFSYEDDQKIMTETQVKKQAKEPEDDHDQATGSVPGRVRVSETARERLKRHRVEVAGRVWIPEMWGQEELLKDWIDCTVFDASLRKSSIMSARAALVEEGRMRASSSGLRIENSC